MLIILAFFLGFIDGYNERDSLLKSEKCYGKYINARLMDIPIDCLDYISNKK